LAKSLPAKLPKAIKPIDTRKASAKAAGVGERTYDAGKLILKAAGELALLLEPIWKRKAEAAQIRKPKSVLLKSGKQKPIHVDKELAKIAGVAAWWLFLQSPSSPHDANATFDGCGASKGSI